MWQALYSEFWVVRMRQCSAVWTRFTDHADAVSFFRQHGDNGFLRWMELIGISRSDGCVRLMFFRPPSAEMGE